MKPSNLKTAFVSVILLLISVTVQAQMDEAYKLANEMVREKLYREDRRNIEVLDNLTDNDILVVRGSYDHIDQVLRSLKIPYAQIDQEDVMAADSSRIKPSL